MNPTAIIEKLWDIPGGILPNENKAQSLLSPIKTSPIPNTLFIPISQPGYQNPEILVEVGEHVLKGQVLARGEDSNGLTAHASSSGIVENIASRQVPNSSGIEEPCITIKTDGKDQWLPRSAEDNFLSLSFSKILDIITEAGISGLGGAGYPSHLKIGKDNTHIHTLIINACECEPFITADDALMRERAADIIQGIKILLHIIKPNKCIIGIEDNKPEAQSALDRANDDARIQFAIVPAKYPSGAQKQLIQILTGTEIPTATFSVEAGILCLNVATVYAIARAVCQGEPLISRITTLTGAALQTPCNMEVLIGTPIAELLEHCGLNHEALSSLLMGGPLMGLSLPSMALPIIKTGNCIIATTQEELPSPPPAQACIRCGYCAEVCPASLLPQQLYWFAKAKDHAKAFQHNVMDCIECGACAYVCPSHIPLVQYYRVSKANLKEEQALHTRAEYSQQRFETRELRLEKNLAIAETKRKERAELSRKNREAKEANKVGHKENSEQATLDPIQAALARIKAKQANNLKNETKPSGAES